MIPAYALPVAWTLVLYSFPPSVDTIRSIGNASPLPSMKLESKYGEMLSRSMRDPLIALSTSSDFYHHLVSVPRNYSTFALFTGSNDPKYCPNCLEARGRFKRLARMYRDGTPAPRAFFVELHEENLPEIFDRLQIDEVPALLHFPPRGRLSNISRMDQARRRLLRETETLKWMRDLDMIEIDVRTKGGWRSFSLFQTVYIVLAVGVGLCWWRNPTLTSEYAKNIVTVLAIILISGHIFNHIGSPPFGSGFAGTRRYQFKIEAYCMTAIYIGMTLGFIGVTEGRRHVLSKSGANGHKTATVGTIIYIFSYWFWMQATRAKG